jgi:hypothetical protein
MYRILHNVTDPDSDLYEIEEAAVIFQSVEAELEEANIFKEALEHAHEFRCAGLNPIYFLDYEKLILYVTSEERITRQYN